MRKDIALSTREACFIAGIDRIRFNQALATGVYTCAPKTEQGRGRKFDFDDILALRCFCRFGEAGY